jgi:hypothetical protein
MKKMQNTHWYRVEHGFTSQPIFASVEEVRRVGLHDCHTIGCEKTCSGSAEEFCQTIFQAEANPSGDTKRNSGTKDLWPDYEWPLYHSKILCNQKNFLAALSW